MKKYLKYILSSILLLIMTDFTIAEDRTSTDSEVLADMLIKGISGIIAQHPIPHGKTLSISYTGTGLTSLPKEAVELLFTREGFLINGNNNANYFITLTVTEARIILQKSTDTMSRSFLVNIHLKCSNSSGVVMFASGKNEIYSDTIPEILTHATDDCRRFSSDAVRYTITKRHDLLWLSSLILLSGLLVYFAFG